MKKLQRKYFEMKRISLILFFFENMLLVGSYFGDDRDFCLIIEKSVKL